MYHCAQLLDKTQHRTVLIIFPLIIQTMIIPQMMSIGGRGCNKGCELHYLKFLTVLQSQHPNSENIRLVNGPNIVNVLHSQNSTMTTGCWLTSAEMNLRHCSPHSHRRQHNPAVHTNIRQQSAVKMQRWPSLYIKIVRLLVTMPMAWVMLLQRPGWLSLSHHRQQRYSWAIAAF